MTVDEDARILVPTATQMHDLGAALGAVLQGGDLVLLSGELGAGKTTLAQGIGRGLGITDPITSPTFVIARVHENASNRPDLVHVDAYRLGTVAEVLDLDLDADLDRSVMVVEWGDGLVEDLSASLVRVTIIRGDDDADETRLVQISVTGERRTDALAAVRDRVGST